MALYSNHLTLFLCHFLAMQLFFYYCFVLSHLTLIFLYFLAVKFSIFSLYYSIILPPSCFIFSQFSYPSFYSFISPPHRLLLSLSRIAIRVLFLYSFILHHLTLFFVSLSSNVIIFYYCFVLSHLTLTFLYFLAIKFFSLCTSSPYNLLPLFSGS